MWQSVISDTRAQKCHLRHVQTEFKDGCNQVKHCQVQRNKLRFPFMRCNLHNLLKSWLISIKKVERFHHDLTNGILTKLESELSTETGL